MPANRSKRPAGRPKTTGTGVLVGVRCSRDMLAQVDAWAADEPDNPSRPESLRRLALRGLGKPPRGAAKPTSRRSAPRR